ncbi:NgoFVII family restriction endonuclease [Heyndrickxia shackletonii]|uniref:NgoFVII family restriction endonuclease n=1 Tax=Heyndrickxia shackletonii TaxID=157838 RepID=A0A0Q3X0B9_9BACI|nr:DUF881 domain-containing protein [Heyndrickxia shackletonii]KQL54715.1 NgoFVII family restriction endonuclease [Heyndrickxia shackletonii]NEY98368.1 DUF881 domain-containing protein [Heyndrickxia shackletonii]
MNQKVKMSFTIITVIIGFMLATQFETVKKPKERDTRDIWELRDALLKEQKLHSTLLTEIRSNDERLEKYKTKMKDSKETALNETLQELKEEAGETNVMGSGVQITIVPVKEAELMGEEIDTVSPDLLKRLLNELNMYGAKNISINNERIINTTVIRDINGTTKVNGHSLNKFPVTLNIITQDFHSAQKLFNQMQFSSTIDEFFVDNLKVSISKPKKVIHVSAFDDPIIIRYMQSAK